MSFRFYHQNFIFVFLYIKTAICRIIRDEAVHQRLRAAAGELAGGLQRHADAHLVIAFGDGCLFAGAEGDGLASGEIEIVRRAAVDGDRAAGADAVQKAF